MGEYAITSTKNKKKGLILIRYFELILHLWKKRSIFPLNHLMQSLILPLWRISGPDGAYPYLLDLHKDNPMNFLIGHNQGAGIYKYFQNSWDCLYVDVNPRDKEMLRLGIGI